MGFFWGVCEVIIVRMKLELNIMIEIPYHKHYVVDASVMVAYVDAGEPNHAEALNFFRQIETFINTNQPVELVIPAHFYLEYNLNIGRKMAEVAKGTNNIYKFRVPNEFISAFTPYDITATLMKRIEDEKLYDKFADKLRVGDFIYAAVSFLERSPLVTLDKDYLKVRSEIDLVFLLT